MWMAVFMRAGMGLSMNLDEYETKAQKLISEALKLVQKVAVDPRIFGKVPLKVLIGNGGGMAPQIRVEFLGGHWKKKTIGAEIDLFLGSDTELAGNIDIFHIEDRTIQVASIEHINPTTMKEVVHYFEKVMSMYAELDDK
jgi:hypothetical protein